MFSTFTPLVSCLVVHLDQHHPGLWCSGITSASHAEGPEFEPRRVHFSHFFSDVIPQVSHVKMFLRFQFWFLRYVSDASCILSSGAVAQMVERLLSMQEVGGSMPPSSILMFWNFYLWIFTFHSMPNIKLMGTVVFYVFTSGFVGRFSFHNKNQPLPNYFEFSTFSQGRSLGKHVKSHCRHDFFPILEAKPTCPSMRQSGRVV